CARKEDDLDCW
nr:immunoglobulin heavy chain junction region [Macaca mulatta]